MKTHSIPFLLALTAALCACGHPPKVTQGAGGPPFDVGERVEEAAEVVEVLQAGSYTYIHYKTVANEARWLASLRTEAEVGEAVQIVRYGSRQDFHSRRLERDFPLLHFGRVIKENEQ